MSGHGPKRKAPPPMSSIEGGQRMIAHRDAMARAGVILRATAAAVDAGTTRVHSGALALSEQAMTADHTARVVADLRIYAEALGWSWGAILATANATVAREEMKR